MSRLELGPEDNPNYVIDENGTGDLEVRDTDGNVIATFTQDQAFSVEVADVTTLNFEADDLEDVTGSRSANTWYQNTADRPLLVMISAESSGAGTVCRSILQFHDSQSTQNARRIPSNQIVAHDSTSVYAACHAVVPPQYYYYGEIFADSLRRWKEQPLGVNQ